MKILLIRGGVILGILLIIYWVFRPSDETGSLGADTYGRKVFIQSLDHSSGSKLKVSSDWHESSLLQHYWNKPLATTIIIRFAKLPQGGSKPEFDIDGFLNQYALWFLTSNDAHITLREGRELKRGELIKFCAEGEIKTFGQFLGAMGFDRLEVYLDNQLLSQRDLPAKNLIRFF